LASPIITAQKAGSKPVANIIKKKTILQDRIFLKQFLEEKNEKIIRNLFRAPFAHDAFCIRKKRKARNGDYRICSRVNDGSNE
jgi:hypothetical protein